MIKRLWTFFTDTIFLKNPEDYRTPMLRWLAQQYKLLFYTARGLIEHGTIIRSAALTFYTLMSIVPIAAVIFAVVKGFGLTEGLIDNLYSVFPQQPEIVDYLVDFADKALARTQGSIVALVGLVMLFWAVIRVFSSIESAFNNIWEVKVTRSVARQFADYVAVVMIAPLLWAVAYGIGSYAQDLLGFQDTILYDILSRLVSLVVIWLMFSFLYIVIPNTKVRPGSALMAGIVAGTLFMLFQWGYIYLQRWMTSYNAIYGSFAALPLLLIWMQTSWEILLFGGELSFAYQNIDRFAEERESLHISYDRRRKVMLAVMLIIVRHFHHAGGALSAADIRDRLGLPTRIVNDVLYQLVQAGLLIAVRSEDNDREVNYTPGRYIGDLTLYNVIEAVEEHGENIIARSDSPELCEVDRLMEQVKDHAGDSGANLRLIDIPENPEKTCDIS